MTYLIASKRQHTNEEIGKRHLETGSGMRPNKLPIGQANRPPDLGFKLLDTVVADN